MSEPQVLDDLVFELTPAQFDDAIRQCLEMGLIEVCDLDEEGNEKYQLTSRGRGYADTSVIHFVAFLDVYDRLQSRLNEAVAVIDKVHETATLNDAKFARFVERELGDFLAKHKEATKG